MKHPAQNTFSAPGETNDAARYRTSNYDEDQFQKTLYTEWYFGFKDIIAAANNPRMPYVNHDVSDHYK
jgi:hypothetical protein